MARLLGKGQMRLEARREAWSVPGSARCYASEKNWDEVGWRQPIEMIKGAAAIDIERTLPCLVSLWT